MVFCKECGSQLDDNSKFCKTCGISTGENNSQSTTQEPVVQQPMAQQPIVQQPYQQPIGQQSMGQQQFRPMLQKRKFEPYTPPEGPLTKDDFTKALKFNFKSAVKIAYSDEFTYIGLQIFFLAAILEGLVFGFMLSNNSLEAWAIFNLIFLYTISFFFLFTFIGEYSLMNSNIEINVKAGLRFVGFLSIYFLIHGLISGIYALYITARLGGGGVFLFISFQFWSLSILGIIILVYLVKYMSLRLGLTGGITLLIMIVSNVITTLIIGAIAPTTTWLLFNKGPIGLAFNGLASASAIVGLVMLEMRKSK